MPSFIVENCWDCDCPINRNLTFLQNINPFYCPSARCKDCMEAREKEQEIKNEIRKQTWLAKRKKLIGR